MARWIKDEMTAWSYRNMTRVPRRMLAEGKGQWLARALPGKVLRVFELDVSPVRPLRIELGSGPWPTPGYVHVDMDRRAKHLEYLAPLWSLPFPDGSAVEILAIHCLEHVHPGGLEKTLAEWRRVLAPGGVLRIHVPDATYLFEAYSHGDTGKKLAITNALFGYYLPAGRLRLSDFVSASPKPDHMTMFDFELLADLLTTAGFSEICNESGTHADRHDEAWVGVVDKFSLIVCAARP
jgi:SAM-dependent methyltransferase